MPDLAHDDFLLDTPQARHLYHERASTQPILDFHCHLSPRHIAEDHRFRNLTELWLEGDHYKWRALRANGCDESLCTGMASDRSKFDAWAATLPRLLRNPLYHWAHLELRRPFGIRECLDPSTADRIWAQANEALAGPGFTARGLLLKAGVDVVCTTDDPTDGLEHHLALRSDRTFAPRVLPTWRPDRARAIADPVQWNAWVDRLEAASGVLAEGFGGFMEALQMRHAAFHTAGCRLSDHGLEGMPDHPAGEAAMESLYRSLRGGRALPAEGAEAFGARLLLEFARMDHAAGWVQQYHLGALRNPNARAYRNLGPDTGFDCIDDGTYIRPLAAHLSRLEVDGVLPKTILYNLNPRDNEALAALAGSFQDGSCPGRIQFGPAWWFLDQLDGMRRQLETLSQFGLLSRFVGMVTDSRSFLSYSRHEYFRRLLCRCLGQDMAQGLVPDDLALVGDLVQDVSCRNARAWFPFGQTPTEVA